MGFSGLETNAAKPLNLSLCHAPSFEVLSTDRLIVQRSYWPLKFPMILNSPKVSNSKPPHSPGGKMHTTPLPNASSPNTAACPKLSKPIAAYLELFSSLKLPNPPLSLTGKLSTLALAKFTGSCHSTLPPPWVPGCTLPSTQ